MFLCKPVIVKQSNESLSVAWRASSHSHHLILAFFFPLLLSCSFDFPKQHIIMMTSSEEASSSSEAEEHYLESFLSVQLPKLGLDYDTYGPYVVGVFNVGQSTDDAAFDENELDQVLELLRASSDEESCSDEVWDQLKRDIIEKHEEYTRELQKVQEKQRQEAHLREQERLRHDIEIARTTQPVDKKHVTEMDEQQKRALVERFAYYEELPEEEESEADILVSNKHFAHEANATKTTKESRSAQKTKTTTKREEQAATKQQKLLKIKAKEERRKRATKSERRR
mmetsp:Transcript_12014/g.21855  ORF Transcript_12014/g.21855 Transcript_12014/m.21855 type:complete len:283 (+) Transcript_12014:148-996(+)